ncbi:hypothetical protein [Bradyrhizobium sp.]|jgi:hypothetical protein|uniref:hypothetical protein n=1 Tax=Bradyrhizobium sp. TaxID=376 RepID=UPI002D5C36AF|nr:hypothetical protein [Bradyrhizobium sp.]HZR71884.1 hypothetical protein [Bradyrhizobium sp.]
MAFFKRELTPVERFETALKDRRAAREKQAERLTLVETAVEEQRGEAERLAVAGAIAAKLGRAELKLRAVEERAKTLRTELAEIDEQIASTERALADARAQRDRDMMADQIEEMAAAIERAAPGFGAGATALVDAVTRGAAPVLEATRFATSVDAVRREVLAAADLICWQLRSAAVRTRAGNANLAIDVPAEPEQPSALEIDRQLTYTLNPLLWREGTEVRRAPAFTLVELPKMLLPVALRHQHVDHLNARRVQTLIHVHGSEGSLSEPYPADLQFVDLDLLAAEEESVQANVA